MLRLSRLVASNLFSFESLDVDFTQWGNLLLLLGINHDEDGLDSNGAGKTSIFNIVCWTFYGKVLDKRDTDEVLRYGENKGFGEVHVGDYVIKRTISGSRKNLEVKNLNNPLDDFTDTKTQDVVNKILGCDYKTFIVSHYMSSDFSKAFIGKDTTPKQRFEVFERFIDSKTLDSCSEFCKKRLTALKDEMNTLEGSKATYEQSLTGFESQETIEAGINALCSKMKKERDVINILQEKINTLVLLKEKHDQNVSFVKAIEKLNFLEEELNSLAPIATGGIKELYLKKDNLKDRILSIENTLSREASPLTCPNCNKSLVYRNGKLEYSADVDYKALKDELAQLKSDKEEIMKLLDEKLEHKNKVEKLNSSIQQLKSLIPDDFNVSDLYFDEAKLDNLQKQFQTANDRMVSYNTECGTLKNDLSRLESNKKGLVEVISKLEAKMKESSNYSFWEKGFKEIKANRVDVIIPLFESETNHIIHTFFDSDMSVIFNTRKALKKGGEKLELNVEVSDSNEALRSFESFSMGQKSRISIALTLARKSILGDESNLDVLLIDELLDSLDDGGQRRFLNIMKDLPYQTMVISHNDNFKSAIDDRLLIEYENGVSKV